MTEQNVAKNSVARNVVSTTLFISAILLLTLPFPVAASGCLNKLPLLVVDLVYPVCLALGIGAIWASCEIG